MKEYDGPVFKKRNTEETSYYKKHLNENDSERQSFEPSILHEKTELKKILISKASQKLPFKIL